MSTGAQDDILAAKAEQLRHAQPGLHGEQQECPISPASPRCRIRCRKECVDFRLRQKAHRSSYVALGRNCQNPLDLRAVFGFLESEELKKGVNRSQPNISSTRAYAAIPFQMLEKRTNKGGVEILIPDRRRQFLQALM